MIISAVQTLSRLLLGFFAPLLVDEDLQLSLQKHIDDNFSADEDYKNFDSR